MGDFEFVVSEGPDKGKSWAFPGNHFYVGAGEECHVRLPASVVQSKHAEVKFDPTGVPWIRDLTGQRLMWLNGEATDKGALQVGAFLRLGKLELVIRQRGAKQGSSGTMATPTPLRSLSAVGGGAATNTRGQSSARNPASGQSSGRLSALNPGTGIDATAKRPTPFRSSAGNPSHSPSGTVEEEAFEPQEATAISSILVPGTIIDGRYEVVGKLAAGGMGEVYRVQHVELGKPMAVKVMLPELSNDPEFVQRFKREAIAASRIGQQNIVDISDFGRTANGRFYFVMEYLDGMTLSSLIHREGAQTPERVVNISAQVARALAAAHAQSIVHRDLKPENIMLLQRPGQADFVKVLDFGVAKVSHGHGQGGHTAVGMVVGTPQYMSPEQAKAIPVDVRSDIYSLGLIVYELVTGRPTFSAETPSMLMVKHVTEQPPPFQPGPLVEVPEALEQLVFHMLQKEPNDRPQTMEEVVGVLDSLWARLKSNDPSLKRVSGNYSPTATPAAPQSGVGIVRASGKVQGVQGHGLTVQSTTTGQTLTEEPVALPQRSKTPIIVMSAIVVVLLIAVGVVLLKPPAEKIVEKPIIVEKPVIIEKPVDKPVDKPPEPVKVEKVKLTFNSNADKTEIYEDDILLGTAPFTLTRDASTISTLVFKAKGFKELKRKVKFESEGTMAIELEKEGGKKGTGGSGTGKTPRGNGLADDPYSQEEELKDAPY